MYCSGLKRLKIVKKSSESLTNREGGSRGRMLTIGLYHEIAENFVGFQTGFQTTLSMSKN